MKKVKLLALFLCLAFAFSCFAGCKSAETKQMLENAQNNPLAQIEASSNATQKVVTKELEDSPIGYLLDAIDGGSISFAYETNGGIIEDVLYIDQEAKSFANLFSIGADGESLNLDAYISGTEIVFDTNALGDAICIGVDFANLSEDIKNSPLMEELGISAEELEPIIEVLTSSLDTIDANIFDTASLVEDIKEIIKDSNVTVEDGSVISGNTTVKCVKITYKLDRKDIADIGYLVIEWVETNFKDEFAILEANGLLDAGELDETFKSIKETLRGEDIKKANPNLVFMVAIDPNTEAIIKTECEFTVTTFEDEDDDIGIPNSVRVILDMGVAASAGYQHSLTFETLTNNKLDESITLKFVNRDADRTQDRAFIIEFDDDGIPTVYEIGYTWNKKTGAFTLKLTEDKEFIELIGKATAKEGAFTVIIESGKNEDKESIWDEGTTLTLIFTPDAEMPDTPDYDNILKMSAEEIQEFIELIGMGEDLMYEDDFMYEDEFDFEEDHT